jgi:hypothetical protein
LLTRGLDLDVEITIVHAEPDKLGPRPSPRERRVIDRAISAARQREQA